jgi:hypothetical protein
MQIFLFLTVNKQNEKLSFEINLDAIATYYIVGQSTGQ